MKLRIRHSLQAALVAILLGSWFGASGQQISPATPPPTIPTFSTANIARRGFFYVGGKYVGEPGKEVMHGSMYVEVWVPKQIQHPYPIVFLHGNGQTATDWMQTPDGRPGWAYYLVAHGYVLYMEDYPARGRSAYVPGVDGPLSIRTDPFLERIWTALPIRGDWPQAKKGGAFPGTGLMGDPVFDNFAKTQLPFVSGGEQEKLALDANVALLDKIGTPVILMTHSQGGDFGWLVADARPNHVKGIVAIEPAAPPMEAYYLAKGKARAWGLTSLPMHYDPPIKDPSELQVVKQEKPDAPDLIRCWVQKEPAHKLINLEHIPVLDVSGEASYHRMYDHCDAKWLNQAGVKTTFLRPEEHGIRGNGHEMMLEKNSDALIRLFDQWMQNNIH